MSDDLMSGSDPEFVDLKEDETYGNYVRTVIEAGIADSDAGRTVPVERLRAQYGLKP